MHWICLRASAAGIRQIEKFLNHSFKEILVAGDGLCVWCFHAVIIAPLKSESAVRMFYSEPTNTLG